MPSAATPDAADIGWDLYRSLLGVLQEGSLSAAARALGITQPTVGRHVAALERAFGAPLFVRSPTGLVAHRSGALAARPRRGDGQHRGRARAHGREPGRRFVRRRARWCA